MITRKIENVIKEISGKFPVISITGPRQSGKTTLAKKIFNDYKYINLENIENRQYAIDDPLGFIKQYNRKVIIDEAQYAPGLFSYVQENVDANRENGKFVLTGSQNFLLSQHISQSLAGRTAVFTLFPFSYEEVKNSEYHTNDLDELLFKGLFPGIYKENLEPYFWYPSYINTYIERDVRNIKAISNLHDFQRFLKICAARTGQIVNLNNISSEIGVTHPTIKSWITVLESSHIIFLLPPYYKNFNKRLIKSPKLYFYDTGLVCSLLGITDKNQLKGHFLKAPLFETFVISEFMKERANSFLPINFYFWRDNVGNELDLIHDEGTILEITEIKSGETINSGFFKAFKYFDKLDTGTDKKYSLIYGGSQNQNRTGFSIKSWKNMFR